ncbi:MAG: hypothetical protein ACYCZR_12015 [Burkholderiales bacterium]
MKKPAIALSIMFTTASLPAYSEPPAWFAAKHPEVRTMERMQAEKASVNKNNHKLAAHSGSAHRLTIRQAGAKSARS